MTWSRYCRLSYNNTRTIVIVDIIIVINICWQKHPVTEGTIKLLRISQEMPNCRWSAKTKFLQIIASYPTFNGELPIGKNCPCRTSGNISVNLTFLGGTRKVAKRYTRMQKMGVLGFILICDLIVIVNVSSIVSFNAWISAILCVIYSIWERKTALIRFLPLVIIHSAKLQILHDGPLRIKTNNHQMNHDCGGETSFRPNKFQSWRWCFQCVCCLHCTMCSVAKTYTTIAGQSIQSAPYLNRDLTYTNWDKNTYFAWFIGHKERQETADFTSD